MMKRMHEEEKRETEVSSMFEAEGFRVSEEGLRRLVEAAQDLNFRIDDEARRLVEEGRTPDYYLGYANGVAGVITLCRALVAKLGTAAEANSRQDAETIAGEHLVMEVAELITMRAAAPAAIAAERFFGAKQKL